MDSCSVPCSARWFSHRWIASLMTRSVILGASPSARQWHDDAAFFAQHDEEMTLWDSVGERASSSFSAAVVK